MSSKDNVKRQEKRSTSEIVRDEKISFEEFLGNITITPSVDNVRQLCQKYRKEAEKVSLSDVLKDDISSDYSKRTDESQPIAQTTDNKNNGHICSSLSIELPGYRHGSMRQGEEDHFILLLNYVRKDGVQNHTIENILKAYEKIYRDSKLKSEKWVGILGVDKRVYSSMQSQSAEYGKDSSRGGNSGGGTNDKLITTLITLISEMKSFENQIKQNYINRLQIPSSKDKTDALQQLINDRLSSSAIKQVATQALVEEQSESSESSGQTDEGKFVCTIVAPRDSEFYEKKVKDIDPKLDEFLNKIAENQKLENLFFEFFAIDPDPDKEGEYLTCFLVVYTGQHNSKNPYESVLSYKTRNIIKTRVNEWSSLIRNKHIRNLMMLVKREAVRSAKAAIMSRNMSHNLGSHVMFYIKQRLESVEKILDSGVLKNLVQASSLDDLEKILREVHIDGDTRQLPFLVGLGRFINYLQERQDYIATVATDYIPYRTTINFKDAIYDELKPEMHAQRHNGDAVGREAANLLLDYIAKSEGFEKSDDIVLLFGKGDGTTFDGSGTPQDVPEDLRNFNVSLPGGNLGRQAFFSIMENIIRNTAKHDGSKSKKLFFQFDRLTTEDITDIEGFSYRYREIYEENPRLNYEKNCYKEFENDFEYLGITIKVEKEESELDDTINKITKGLTSKYLSSDGKMNDDYKGIKEIRLSAAWIRGEKLDFEMPMNQPPAVSIRKNNIDGKKYLQYVICLPKSKKIAIVSNSLQDAEEYHKQGCKVFKPDNLKGISDYELVVYDNNMEDDIFKKEIQPISGARVFAEKITDTIKSDIIEGKFDVLYDKWLENAFQKDFSQNTSVTDNVKLSIIDSKQKATSSSENLKVTTDTATADEDYYENNIVFNTHYKGQASSGNRDLFAKARFVEAISGGNSTDRLIRHDKRTAEWYCKHIAAGMSNVAVFDERLYSIIIPKNWMNPLNIEELVKEYFENGNSFDADSYTDFMTEKLNLTYEQESMLYKASKEVKVNSISQEAVIRSSLLKDYSNTWKYREKGIWGFDICIEKDKGIVRIMGYNAAPTRGQIGLYDHKYRETCIAMIRKGERTLSQCVDGFAGKFDFISIHQGILDKIYDALGVKEDNEKEIVTKAIFDYFSCKKNEAVSLEGDKYYLPQFIIHSGRSKPNKKDMPQHLPFLQFSAIDHAVRDCKYTLTELLYSAHYEEE